MEWSGRSRFFRMKSFPHLLAFLSIGWLASAAHGATLSPWIDPTCGLPGLRFNGEAGGRSDFRILGSSNLADPQGWETLVEMSAGTEGGVWRDLSGHQHLKRFFRLEHVPIRPPLNAVDNFRLIDQTGRSHELQRAGDARAYVFVFTDNESLSVSWPELRQLRNRFASQGVRFWFINPADDRSAIASTATALGVDSPVLHDRAQLVARAFRCSARQEVVAVRGDDFTPFYRGAVSELCTTTQPPVVQNYLADALDQMLAEKPVDITFARPTTAAASIRSPGSIDYAKDIAPILQKRCVTCHRQGDIGSFQMDSYATIVEKSYAIRRDVITGDMPPWHVDPASGHFSNDFSLLPEEASKIVAWIDSGAPRGVDPDPLVVNPVAPAKEWPLGEPDYKIKLDPQSVPASGTVDYIYVGFQNPLPTNAWLKATVVKPGNRGVVHHVLAFAGSFAELAALKGGLGGYFAAYVPGMEQTTYPAGTGKLLKPGSWFLIQLHYTTNGRETTDQTEIGIYFAKEKPSMELKTMAAYSTSFVIPPNTQDHEAVAVSTAFAKASYIYEVGPHMHYRGSRMRFEALLPNGTVRLLANVPAYQFDWQTVYRLAEPVLVPAGTKVRVVGGFDNSRYNPRLYPEGDYSFNAQVRFGEQSWEEMLIGYVNFAEAK